MCPDQFFTDFFFFFLRNLCQRSVIIKYMCRNLRSHLPFTFFVRNSYFRVVSSLSADFKKLSGFCGQ